MSADEPRAGSDVMGERLTVGSLFSGIGGLDLGLERAGMRVAWQCEKDERARAVLDRRWPDCPVYDDVTSLRGDDVAAVDVLCGGFPCQDLSVAGSRAGLAGERSGLFHEFMRVAGELAPRWVLIENVPGLLSSNAGRDMGTVVGVLADLGYGWAYRVLDAQFFGVAQRRRRVFIVGCADRRADRAAQVLLEPESCAGDSAPSREAGKDVAGTLGGGAGERGWASDTERMTFVPTLARSLTAGERWDGETETDFTPTLPVSQTIAVAYHSVAAPLTAGMAASPGVNRPGRRQEDDVNLVGDGMAVRRLTPVECERLQGFPDGWTDGQPDSSRYRQLGNAVCVPVAAWIGRRIAEMAA